MRLVWPWAWELGLDLYASEDSLGLTSLYLALDEEEKPLCTLTLAGLAVL